VEEFVVVVGAAVVETLLQVAQVHLQIERLAISTSDKSFESSIHLRFP